MAVLEAFVYDPLLNWRLIDGMSDICRGGALLAARLSGD